MWAHWRRKGIATDHQETMAVVFAEARKMAVCSQEAKGHGASLQEARSLGNCPHWRPRDKTSGSQDARNRRSRLTGPSMVVFMLSGGQEPRLRLEESRSHSRVLTGAKSFNSSPHRRPKVEHYGSSLKAVIHGRRLKRPRARTIGYTICS